MPNGIANSFLSAEDIEISSQAKEDDIWDIVPVEEVTVTSEQTHVYPGQSLKLDVILQPEYAKYTAKNIEYEVIFGSSYATIEGSTLIVKEDPSEHNIGKQIQVIAIVDGIKSQNILSFDIVRVQVDTVKILNAETQIAQGKTLQISTQILPENSTSKKLDYCIISGNEYATINSTGLIRVKPFLERGDLSIEVKVSSVENSSVFDIKRFDLYVPTRNLALKASNYIPLCGDCVQLLPLTDDRATICVPNYEIISGEEYIESLTDNLLKIKQKITNKNPQIVLRATRDNIKSLIVTLNIYIPTYSLTLTTDKFEINQGEKLNLTAIPDVENATLTNLKYFIEEQNFATISSSGVLTSYVMNDIELSTVHVWAEIDGITSNVLEIRIKRPQFAISWDKNPESRINTTDKITLSASFDGATIEDVEFCIVSGQEYIKNFEGKTIEIKSGIEVKQPQIKLYAIYGEFISSEYIIDVYIPVQEILLKNSNVTKVEQGRNYLFESEILPKNANFADSKLIYSLNVGSEVAEISESGELTIKNDAPIGSEIVLTISAPDNIKLEHTVIIEAVNATKIEINKIEKENKIEITEADFVYPGELLTVSLNYLEPFNVSKERQKFYLLPLTYSDCYTIVDDCKIQINNEINYSKPTFALRAVYAFDESLYIDFEINVYIPVTKVALTKVDNAMVFENSRILISKLVNAEIYPLCSNVREVEYSIIEGTEYARLDGKYVVISEVPAGDIKLKIHAEAEGVQCKSDVEFVIYVKALEFENIEIDNRSPMSSKACGEEVVITPTVSTRATTQEFTFEISRGKAVVEKIYIDNDLTAYDPTNILTGKKLKIVVAKNASEIGEKFIQIIINHRDDISQTIDLEVYIPIEDVYFSTDFGSEIIDEIEYHYIERGTTNILKFDFTTGATNAGLKNPDTGEDNWEIVDKDIANVFSLDGTVAVPQNTPAGTLVNVTFKSLDRMENTFVAHFIIKKFDEPVFKFKVDENPSSAVPYGRDSQGDIIDNTKPQLWVGRETEVVITLSGLDLQVYGLKVYTEDVNQSLTLKTVNSNTVKLLMSPDARGDYSCSPTIKINDGTAEYEVQLPKIEAFRPMSGKVVLKDADVPMKFAKKQLELEAGEDWDHHATYKITDIEFLSSKLLGAQIVSGQLCINANDASKEQIIVLRCLQKYNGLSIPYLNENNAEYTVTQCVCEINFDFRGGHSGTARTIGVDGWSNQISIPTLNGWSFLGYYTQAGGNGIQCYNSGGELNNGVNFSDLENTTLYAYWSKTEQFTAKLECNVWCTQFTITVDHALLITKTFTIYFKYIWGDECSTTLTIKAGKTTGSVGVTMAFIGFEYVAWTAWFSQTIYK